MIQMMAAYARSFFDRTGEVGQGVVEYALVIGVIVVLLFLAFQTMDVVGALSDALGDIVSILETGEAANGGETEG